MPVSYIRPEVTDMMGKWTLVKDCIAGQDVIKKKGDAYLPRPNASDKSQENKDRFAAYLERAVFYNVTKRTLDGLVGQVFTRAPVMQLPTSLQVFEKDLDGGGVGLDQQAKKSLSSVMAFGRCALLVDFPSTDETLSKADQEAGFVRPTITFYNPWDVVNWRTILRGARQLLSLVVLQEFYIVEDDGFEVKTQAQWRVLRLVDSAGQPAMEDSPEAFYQVEIYRQDSGQTDLVNNTEIYQPVDSAGQHLTEIPFTFIGALNNDTSLDQPPLYDLAALNIAHYRNSADYEESCFIAGQPTPYFAGLTQQWVDDNFKEKGVQLGVRSAVVLPAGGTAGLIQAQENSMPKEAMEVKERQMVALGAKLVEQKQVQRTLGEAVLDEASETSVLSTAAKNVSEAYTKCLEWAGWFTGESAPSETVDTETGPLYQLSSDYPASRMSPQERAQLMAEWQSGGIAFSEMREQLRKAGIATLTDDEAKDEIESNPPSPAIGGVWNSNNPDPNNPAQPSLDDVKGTKK